MAALINERKNERTDLVARTRWRLLGVTCMGTLMIVFDATIVNVAIPQICADLSLSGSALVWIVNGYNIPYGVFLPVCGRLGDHYGRGRLFVGGVMLFALASLACGLARTTGVLIGARIVQGIGGAAVAAASAALVMERFLEVSERAKAFAILSAVSATGSSVAILLGGLVTAELNWRWIFLGNLPIALSVSVCFPTRPTQFERQTGYGQIDFAGAITVSLSLIFAVLGVLRAAGDGWWSVNTLLPLSAAVVFGFVFISIENRVSAPILPFRLLGNRNLILGVLIGGFWAAGQSAWFLLCSLYLQLVLKYNPFEVGLSFLPACLATAAFSVGVSARFVARFGISFAVTAGLSLVAVGLAFFARAPVNATFATDVLPGMVLFGVGCGMAYSPLVVCALRGVSSADYGAASGVFNSASVLGGACALALLAGIASARTSFLIKGGVTSINALNSGYHLAFWVCALLAAVAVLGTRLFRADNT